MCSHRTKGRWQNVGVEMLWRMIRNEINLVVILALYKKITLVMRDLAGHV